MQLNKKIFWRWVKAITIVYCSIGIAVYYLQDKFLFHPVAVPADSIYAFKQPYQEINLPYDSASNINIIHFLADTTTAFKGYVLYLHGNRENVGRYALFSSNFTSAGYHVLMPDYAGFGKSTGTLSEQSLYDYSLAAYNLVRSKTTADSIVVYGKSLGTGLATYIASRKNCKQVILETPYSSITSLFNRYLFLYPVERMIHYKIPSIDYLQKVVAPVTIFEAGKDWVIPNGNTEALKKVLKVKDQFIVVEEASHNNMNNYKNYQEALKSLLR